MIRQGKNQYKYVITTLIEEYSLTQNLVLQIASYDEFEEWAKRNDYFDSWGKEISSKNIITWVSELDSLRKQDEKVGLTGQEVEQLKVHTWRLEYYIQRVEEYKIAMGYDLDSPLHKG